MAVETIAAEAVHDILLVDDHPAERTLVRDALALAAPGLRLHEVENAVQAFWFLSRQREYSDQPTPELVLLDLSMPVIDGKRVLEILRRDEQWRRLPVIVLTNSGLDDDLADCKRLGADAFVTKPALWRDYLALGRLIDDFVARRSPPRPTGGVRAHFFGRRSTR